MRRALAILSCSLLVLGVVLVSADPAGAIPELRHEAENVRVEGLPGELRLNEIQTVGTHNSYHLQPPQPLVNLVSLFYPDVRKLEYSHLPLAEQFGSQGIRQVELDVYADSEGGRWAKPRLGLLSGANPRRRPEMHQPGFKVMHLNEVDFLTTCTTLVLCLQELKAWSDLNAGHVPIMVMLELHDRNDVEEQLPSRLLRWLRPTDVEPVTVEQLDQLDGEIRSVFDDDELITPGFVRGDHPSVAEAIKVGGWPTLAESAGRVMFTFDNTGTAASLYRRHHPDLRRRVMFTDGIGFRKMNWSSPRAINQAVEAGFMVRARADDMTADDDRNAARSGSTARRDALFASGAQWISTDWPSSGLTDRFGTDYSVELPGGVSARCNPVLAPGRCTSGLTVLHRGPTSATPQFDYELSGPTASSFSLYGLGVPRWPGSWSSQILVPGTYRIRQETPDAWLVERIRCSTVDPDGTPTGEVRTRDDRSLIRLELRAGEHTVCEFVSTREVSPP